MTVLAIGHIGYIRIRIYLLEGEIGHILVGTAVLRPLPPISRGFRAATRRIFLLRFAGQTIAILAEKIQRAQEFAGTLMYVEYCHGEYEFKPEYLMLARIWEEGHPDSIRAATERFMGSLKKVPGFTFEQTMTLWCAFMKGNLPQEAKR
jgi:hypothetical protein